MSLRVFYGILIVLLASLSAQGSEKATVYAERALALTTQEWSQQETDHFVIYYAKDVSYRQVAVEAEFYFRFITEELGVKVGPGDGRYHIFIFENAGGWVAFSQGAKLEIWTGAVLIGRELFVPRFPEYRFKGHALAHELVHLVVNQYFPRRLPLWLSEGYAEEAGLRAYGAFMRRSGYRPRPYTQPVGVPFSLEELMSYTEYPENARVVDFYRQSRQLTAFLYHQGGRERFLKTLRSIGDGESFEAVLATIYPREWPSVAMLEEAFAVKMIVGPEEAEPRAERD